MATEIITTQSPPLQLQDRVAIVTGCSHGINRAIPLHLASLGAKLIINFNSNSTEADQLVSEINSKSQSQSPCAVSVKADISDPFQVKSLFDKAESAFDSPLCILVNAAGVLDSSYSSIANSSVDEFDRTFSVNTRGAYLCCKEAANRLKQGGGGRIICLTSSMVVASTPGYGAYAASKAAVEAMVKILTKELKETRITVHCVTPEPIYQSGRIGPPEDIALLVGILASDDGEEWYDVIVPNHGLDFDE